MWGMCINCEHSVSPSCSSGDDMDDAPPVAQVAPADANDEAPPQPAEPPPPLPPADEVPVSDADL